jgi:dienelactone hydrolase
MRIASGFLLLLIPLISFSQEPRSYPAGEKLIMGYFKEQVKQISESSLKELGTRETWQQNRPEMRRQFLDMMGLWPMPAKTDLRATITGTVVGDGFIVEKLHFQSMPGLYVTANLYRPKNPPAKKLPAILYVCGHGNVVENGISYGSKVYYQYHPAWFAKHGYVSLVLDTLQLGEIQGLHHGTYRLGMWWWQSRGYTPGGVELWNGIRALDYLESREDVDSSKIGLTGRSGGGASSWWIAAADDRIKAVAPVAGIADLQAQVLEGEVDRLKTGVIAGHCDCMFMVNKYRWDFGQVMALVAPRPLLLGNSDADDIFPVGGYRRIASKVSKVYELLGAGDKFQLLETKGPHVDTPELRIGINRFMNRYLKGDTTTKVEDDLPSKLKPEQLKVFREIPLDSVNENVHEVFTKEHDLELPKTDREIRHWWAVKQSELKKRLEREVFSGWPSNPPDLQPKLVEEVFAHQVRMQSVEFLSEQGMPLKLWIVQGDDQTGNARVEVVVWDHQSWPAKTAAWGPSFSKLFGMDPADATPYGKNDSFASGYRDRISVFIAPRGVGPTQWAVPGSSFDIQVQRRFALLGQTLAGQQAWDVRRGIAAAFKFLKIKSDEIDCNVAGDGNAATLALYAALFEPRVKRLELTALAPSVRQGPALLNASKVIETPWAVALMFPRPVKVLSREEGSRNWLVTQSISDVTQSNAFRFVQLSGVPPLPPPPPRRK